MTGRRASLKSQVIEVSQDYFGPAASRFIDRQIAMHLKKDPDSLTKEDLVELLDWLKLSFALLTKNAELIDEYTSRLQLIASGRANEALGRQWPTN